MGTNTFDAFLQDYYTTHKWGIADGDAFRQLAEQHCQCDLSNLFDEWVY
jgi:aminopeptidase N